MTVGRILTNEMYTGVMIQSRRRKVSYKSKVIIDTLESEWYRVEDTHEAIIDRATFEAVQRGFKLRTRTDGTGETHPDVRLPHIDTEGKTSIQNLKTFDSQ